MKKNKLFLGVTMAALLAFASPALADIEVDEEGNITVDDLNELEELGISLEDLLEETDETDLYGESDDEEEYALYGGWYVEQSEDFEGDLEVILNDARILLPSEWAGKYDIVLGQDRVTFYHRGSRAAWYLNGYDEGGILFELCTSPDESFQEIPETYELGRTSDGGFYYLRMPTDAQGYAEDEKILAEYQKLYGDMDKVKEYCYSMIVEMDEEETETEETETEE